MLLFSFSIPPKMKIKLTTEVSAPKNTNLNCHQANLLDAVIGLPENLFYGTPIPACILVFKKNRANKDILFIDASGKDPEGNLRYKKDKNQNILEKKHIDDIIKAYLDRKDANHGAE